MKVLIDFLADYYVLLAIVSVVILFAIIGFMAGERKKKNKGGVETASATDQPINNDVSIAPETPVMMAEESQPLAGEVVNQSMPTPVVPEIPLAQQTPAEEKASAPTLVIDNPEEPTNEITENVAVVEQPVLEEKTESAPTLVIDEPTEAEVPSVPDQPSVPEEQEVQNVPEESVSTETEAPSVLEENVQPEGVVENNLPLPDIEEPVGKNENITEDNSAILEPVSQEEVSNEATEVPTPEEIIPTDQTGSIFENPEVTGTGSIFENEINK